jgi:hypothetical protein
MSERVVGTALALALSLVSSAAAGEEGIEFTTPKAKEAHKTYTKTQERLKADYEAKLRKARDEYLKALEASLKEARKAAKSDEVSRLEKAIEDLKKEGATVSKEATKPARTPATTEKGPGKVTFEGRNGDSLENAIIIQGARDGQEGVDAEHWWLRKHFPGYQPKGQGLLHREGKAYDKLEIVLPDGKQKEVFFDITSFFGT